MWLPVNAIPGENNGFATSPLAPEYNLCLLFYLGLEGMKQFLDTPIYCKLFFFYFSPQYSPPSITQPRQNLTYLSPHITPRPKLSINSRLHPSLSSCLPATYPRSDAASPVPALKHDPVPSRQNNQPTISPTLVHVKSKAVICNLKQIMTWVIP
ncbi:hypothetical protein CC80DRAFT_134052 [Byssothecium circinans]|uniref:Uncharacterized protein n=1 Tax=Byssothecium circinans TaxID=147558 RepID=A0A6A5TM55_9PLEO|nr:hypothetical protein CC80DRAFT_134052 [Byssothecium circinans]